jgi:hypothetical protein
VIAISLLDPIAEDVDTVAASPAEMIITAANGVRWRRLSSSTSSAEELLAALEGLGGDRIAREWSLWREGGPSDAQRDKAAEFLAVAGQEIEALEAPVGDPDAIADEHGDLPATRRGYNLDLHMRLFRHEALRAWSKRQRPRFRQLLAMRVPQPADMCPECQALADWHTYAVSLRLFQTKPEPGSQAETIARLPGWWERCPASTSIQIRQQWGQGLPDFDGAQWQAILTPLLRAIFAPAPPRQREKPDQRAVLERRLRSAEAEASRIRRELGELGPDTDEGRHQ